jgi:hypothetical protein
MVRNLSRLIIASNERWVVPAGINARRWCVLDVADAHANDREYFGAIDKQLHEDGGMAGLMHLLTTFDLKSVDVYKPPKTQALLEQKEESFQPHLQWWTETLERGTFRYPDDGGRILETTDWPTQISKQHVWDSYALWAKQHNIKGRVLPITLLHRWLSESELLPGHTTTRPREGVIRQRMLQMPDLQACREAFNAYLGQSRDWELVQDGP